MFRGPKPAGLCPTRPRRKASRGVPGGSGGSLEASLGGWVAWPRRLTCMYRYIHTDMYLE